MAGPVLKAHTIKDDHQGVYRGSMADVGRPQVFGAGISLGMFAGIVIGSLVTLWLGEVALEYLHRTIDRVSGRREQVNFELLLQ
jgi:hypothetical protein